MMSEGKRAVSIGKLHYRDTSDPNGFDEEIIPMHIIQGVGMLFTICRNPMPTQKNFHGLWKTLVQGIQHTFNMITTLRKGL